MYTTPQKVTGAVPSVGSRNRVVRGHQQMEQVSKKQLESTKSDDVGTAALAISERAPDASALLQFTDDLLDEIDTVLEGSEVLAMEYTQVGGE